MIHFNKFRNYYFIAISVIFCGILVFSLSKTTQKLYAQENDECLACHEDATLKATAGGKTYSVYVNKKLINKSVHSANKCINCHEDLAKSEFPHAKPKKAKCGSCHKEEQALYNECLHGKSYNKGDRLAPTCQSCHGSHTIVPNKDRKSPVYPLNIPNLCGKCHKEGSPVQLQRKIPQTHILENYAESIHGEGLIKKGLVVSATCASCHSPHRILPHTDPRSTIARKNIAATCTKCHAAIESVHKKIIKGELWEKEAKVLPACVDCHQPHKARKVFYQANVADDACKKCHDNHLLKSSKTDKKLAFNSGEIAGSVHVKIACSQCHIDINPDHTRPCDNITKKVDCSSCHTEVGDDYKQSFHGILLSRGDQNAPSCEDCHGSHNILKRMDERSTVFPLNIPKLCSRCHQEGKQTQRYFKGGEHLITVHYSESIHGKGLIKSGLTVTATCANCHTAHKGLPPNNPNSSVNPKNISKTCGTCHYGIHEKFDKSVHSPNVTKTDKKLPVCNDCHTAHTIKRTESNNFRTEIINMCGKCHVEITETYFDTYHGKVSKLGSAKAAKCYDCHGSHDILPVDDQKSHLSRTNIVSTCKKCHPNATPSFTRYLTHATHKDSRKYPILFLTFWGMTFLLLGTFSLSFLHTLLWLPRSINMRKKMKAFHKEHGDDKKQYMRFSSLERALHFIMINSFLTLAITGLTIKFSYTPLAGFLVRFFGGTETTGNIHRVAATILFGIFITHVIDLFRKKKHEFGSWKAMLLGPETMLPNKKDLKDFVASIKWFLGKGERPSYGRWTYWEKFDYFAVFWGVFVIGFTGLSLWFPELFAHVLPGWLLNVATIIHSDEALLAAGFIFTVHFFNTHFRPEKFPMDSVIFSGQIPVEELEFDRPEEYKNLIESGKLEASLKQPFSPSLLRLLRIFGFAALVVGLCVVVWIIYAMLIAY
ncbi:MAG: hypothetical protein WCT77_04795 [Bacteroidota bacterium]